MTGVKTAWYKTRWGVAAMAGVVGISLGSGMAGNNKEHAAAPVSYTTAVRAAGILPRPLQRQEMRHDPARPAACRAERWV